MKHERHGWGGNHENHNCKLKIFLRHIQNPSSLQEIISKQSQKKPDIWRICLLFWQVRPRKWARVKTVKCQEELLRVLWLVWLLSSLPLQLVLFASEGTVELKANTCTVLWWIWTSCKKLNDWDASLFWSCSHHVFWCCWFHHKNMVFHEYKGKLKWSSWQLEAEGN